MSDNGKKEANEASNSNNQSQYDPSTLLALYSMSNAYGMNTGAASNPAAAQTFASSQLGLNQWWTMASQLAAQEYLTRIQAAARDPQAYAALAAQGVLPNYEMLTGGSKARLKLPNDTEIIKYTSSATGAKEPGSSTRGRKKTISLDPSLSNADYASLAANVSSSSNESTPPSIPAGLTIERKRPGSAKSSNEDRSSSPAIDRVEITKIPANGSSPLASSFMPKSSTPKASGSAAAAVAEAAAAAVETTPAATAAGSGSGGAGGETPLNLSTKSSPFMSPISGAAMASADASSPLYTSKSIGGAKIPQEYYASQALSGVFLAEQIRQQQLAAALESRLDSQSFSAMQAALLMNKLKAGAAVAETSKLLAAAAAAAASSAAASSSSSSSEAAAAAASSKTKSSDKKKASRKNLAMGDKLNKNTVASLLAKSRELAGAKLTPEELENAEKSWTQPELTIEPIFRSLKPDSSVNSGDEFDSSDNGRRTSSVMEDGKLKIKTVSDSPEIRNLSDDQRLAAANASNADSASESDDGSATNSSESKTATPSGTSNLNSASNNNSKKLSNNCGRAHGKYATVETEELRLPLQLGWRREITVREYSKSGIRGDVLYYAPCGKKFKQYPDIIRYLEKKGIKNLQREHFSFSTKVFIGDFLKPTGMSENGEEKYARLTEKEMYEDIDKLRRENGWKPRRRGSKSSKSDKASTSTAASTGSSSAPAPTSSSGATSNALAAAAAAAAAAANPLSSIAETLLQKMQAEMQLRPDQQDSLRLQQEALRMLAEAERLEKMELSRREKEARQLQQQEAKRRRQEEQQRQKQEEQLRKIQEREQKRQQTALIKEQAKQYEQLLYHQTMERERRKQHMILMKQLEAKKRSDEREKKREDMRIRSERERERRMEQKRLELEVINEMRKPIEDMSLDDHRDLPELKRIPGLRLSGEAFANLLMIFEFLNNFGETLGFDMESLPTMDSLQAALLYDQEAEEELLSVVIHLVVCAIEDPGIPFFVKQLTILGQNLRQADITNTNISEILRIYLTARGQAEVKLMHNCNPPQMLHAKDPRRETMFTPEKIEEYNELLKKTRGFKYADMVKDKSFLCLNPSEKSEIIAFICNELLSNKAVVRQIDNNVEAIGKAKKEKWETEAHLKRLKIIQAKKSRSLLNQSTNHDESSHTNEVDEDKDETMSEVSEVDSNTPGSRKRSSRNKKGASSAKKKKIEPPEDDMEETNMTNMSHDNHSDSIDLAKENAEDEKLSPEELQKKIDKANRKLTKKRDELAFISNRVRVHDLGQDRYRRRYHHFAYAGGVYVEAVESCEPWKLETKGMPHFTEDGRDEVLEKDSSSSENKEDEEMEIDDNEEEHHEEKPHVNGDHDKENIKKEDQENEENGKEEKIEEMEEDETKAALAKLSSEILVTPKVESKLDMKFLPKVTPNGEKLNMFNHTSNLNMTLSPIILNGAVTITPKDQMHYQHNFTANVNEKPWFSILPIGSPVDHQAKLMEAKENMFADTITPQINALEAKLEELRSLDLETDRKQIPDNLCRGWWRLSDIEDVNQLEASLNSRGTREQHLLTLFKRNFELLQDTAKRPLPDHMTLEPPEGFEDLPKGMETAEPDAKGHWSNEAALRVDKYILEQVEALEDKVAAASMQVPGWRVPNKGDIDSRQFRPACLYNTNQVDPNDEFGPEAVNPVAEARERLIDLELNIERRYLKAPLGCNANVNLQNITARITKTSAKARENEDDEATNDGEANNEDKEEEEMEEEEAEDSENVPEKTHLPRGLVMWREGVKNAETAAQLAMAFYVLETSIAWHKSIMKAFCQLCNCGDNEDSLLLCDGCDKGYHTYCFKPSLENIPEGDWYCYECINKATNVKHCLVCGKQEGKNLILCITCPRAYHTTCLSPALSKVPRGKWQCPGCNQKGPKKSKSRKKGPPTHLLQNPESDESPDQTNQNSPAEPSKDEKDDPPSSPEPPPPPPPPPPQTSKKETNSKPASPQQPQQSPASATKKKKPSKMDKDLTICHTVISEMEALENAWPFMQPVNTKQFPTYKKVIKQPMDLNTIKKKLDGNVYKLRDEFVDDVRLIFTNCELFNEDDSPVGKAGHAMLSHFEARWTELTSI